MKLPTEPNQRKGFSLIEVVVSASIGTGIILMMAVTMRFGSEGFGEATRRIDAIVEARAALDILSDDVSTMVGSGQTEFGWQDTSERFHEVWFLTLKPLEAQDPDRAVGDVCFVHYFTAVTRDAPVADAAFSRKLYRRFLSSGDMLQRLNTGQLPRPVADPEQAEAVAFNVTRFVAQPLTGAGAGVPLTPWVPGNGLPVSLNVDFQVIDSQTAGALRTPQDWELTTNVAQSLIVENNDNQESMRGRDFTMNLEIGHAN